MAESKKQPERMEETLAPVRNFSITLEDRMRAADGPPAYMRRKRAIEDIEESMTATIRKLAFKLARANVADLRRELLELARVRVDVREINRLIETHNRYYPIEANLPIHPITGELLERGGHPWRKLELITLEALVDRVLAESTS